MTNSEATTPVGECDCVYCAEIGAPELCRGYRLVSAPAVVGDVYDRLLTFLGDRDNAIQGDPPCATELDASVHEILEIVRRTPSTASPDREEIVAAARELQHARKAQRSGPPFTAAQRIIAASDRLDIALARRAVPGGGEESEAVIERVARAIAVGCNLDPDAISPKAALAGHTIPEWMFFRDAAFHALAAIRSPE